MTPMQRIGRTLLGLLTLAALHLPALGPNDEGCRQMVSRALFWATDRDIEKARK